MPLQFSSDLKFLEVDVRLCHRRVEELRARQGLIQPTELDWLGRKLASMEEYFDGQEQDE